PDWRIDGCFPALLANVCVNAHAKIELLTTPAGAPGWPQKVCLTVSSNEEIRQRRGAATRRARIGGRRPGGPAAGGGTGQQQIGSARPAAGSRQVRHQPGLLRTVE